MNCSVQADRQVEHEVSRQLHSERLRERSGGARGHREQRRSRSHSRLVGARRFRAGGPARPCRSWQPHAARGERRRPLDLRPEPAPAGAFWISAAITAPLLLLAMGDFLPGPIERWLSPSVNVWLQLALAAPVVLWGGWPFLQRGWASLENRSLNIFTLIALGTLAAFGFSLFATLFPTCCRIRCPHGGMAPVYYEAAR